MLIVVYGFLGMIAAGTILLMLPVSSSTGLPTSFIDSLFTATSATCITGLVVVDTLGHWSYFGQAVILILIQSGGLGFMTSATILLVAAGRRISLRERILIGESVGLPRIGGAVRLVRNIVFFVLSVEAIGAMLFYIRFSGEYEWNIAIWKSVFHAVSAFNNAGFDLFGGFRSLSGYSNDYTIILTTAVLIILGGISFIVISDMYRSRGLKRSSANTKLVFYITIILLAAGTLVVLITEFNNPQTIGEMSLQAKISNAFFQSVTSRSAGFSTFSMGAMTFYAFFFTLLLMFIGGATGSTAGGIKVNTFGLLMATIISTIRGREHPGAFGREFPVPQIFRAVTILVIALGLIAAVFLILSATENFSSNEILFEAISAVGIVGLSTGITPGLSVIGKAVILIIIFIGRLGPLTLSLALARAQRETPYRFPKESIRIG